MGKTPNLWIAWRWIVQPLQCLLALASHPLTNAIKDLPPDSMQYARTAADILPDSQTPSTYTSELRVLSTWVAQMMGLPALLQRPIIIFCARKTFSAGISIPRSPRATIMPSLASMISSNLTTKEEIHYPLCSEGGLSAVLPFLKGSITLRAWCADIPSHIDLPDAILVPCNTIEQFLKLYINRLRGARVYLRHFSLIVCHRFGDSMC